MDSWRRVAWVPAMIVLLALAGCATSASPGSGAANAVDSFDGRYAGPFVLQGAASADICPVPDRGQAVMVVRGGNARAEVAQTAYFSGRVSPDGGLILMSGQGRSAVVSGRIASGTYTAAGRGDCLYQVRLTRTQDTATP